MENKNKFKKVSLNDREDNKEYYSEDELQDLKSNPEIKVRVNSEDKSFKVLKRLNEEEN